jgi:hypothetical protein
MDNLEPEQGEVVSFSSPRLTPIDKLYVRTYLATLSHPRAHEACTPGILNPKIDNPFSRKEAIQFHISLGLQEKAEALDLSPELIIEKLYKEAIREGAGSNHAARIAALTQLGKHFGLFTEKKENNAHTFNIVNYSTPIKIEQAEERVVEEPTLELPVDIDIVITEY